MDSKQFDIEMQNILSEYKLPLDMSELAEVFQRILAAKVRLIKDELYAATP